MNDAHDNAATDREMLARYATDATTDANGNPINVNLPIDLMPSVQDWHEAQQEARKILQALLAEMDCVSVQEFEQACLRVLTYYLVTGHLPARDAASDIEGRT
jgi:hypothetical protein